MDQSEIDLNELDPQPSDTLRIHEQRIGQTPSISVYRAMYEGLPVGVKLIYHNDPKEIMKECQVLLQVPGHPNIWQLQGFLATDQYFGVVMELGTNGNLSNILSNKTLYPNLPWSFRLSIALDILRGLKWLHKWDIIHYGIKSSNILIRSTWQVFLSDIGLNRMLQNVGYGCAWMAPELHEERMNPTSAIDVFSYGMILYQLLTRLLPFSNQKLKPTQIIVAMIHGKRPLLPNENENENMIDCPEGYIELMKECWRQDPSQRPKVDEIWKRLRMMTKNFKLETEKFLVQPPVSKPQVLPSPSSKSQVEIKNFKDSPRNQEQQEEQVQVQEPQQEQQEKQVQVQEPQPEQQVNLEELQNIDEKTRKKEESQNFGEKTRKRSSESAQTPRTEPSQKRSDIESRYMQGDWKKTLEEMEKGTNTTVFEKDEKHNKIIRREALLALKSNEHDSKLCWEYKNSDKKTIKDELNLAKVTDVMTVSKKDPFWSTGSIEGASERTAAIISKDNDLHVEFQTVEEMNNWILGINKILVSKGRRVTVPGRKKQAQQEVTYQPDA